MRRLALLVAGLAILAVAVATTAGAEDPKGSEFLTTGLRADEFHFPSTSGWDIKGPETERLVQEIRESNPKAAHPLDRQGMAVLWAKRCKIGEQEVHFQRDVFLAGPEDLIGAGISFFRGTNSAGFKGARMVVNGREVLDVGPGGGGFDRTDKKLSFFRFGRNRIEVIAEKRPNPRPRRCNDPIKKHNFTGVAFNVYGELAGDVSLPPQQAVEYRRLPEDALFSTRLQLDFSLRNNGPGGLARVPLYINLKAPVTGEPRGTIVKLASPESPVHSCTVTPPGNEQGYDPATERTVVCMIANLRSGETARQHVDFTLTPVAGSGRTPVYLRWSAFVDEPKGADGTDNERFKTIWICKYDDPGEECGPK